MSAKYFQKEQLRNIEQSMCGGAPKGMPQRARTMFGTILASMSAIEQRNVQEECKWSRSSDIPEHVPKEANNQARASPSVSTAKMKRQQRKKSAGETGTQYGNSKHATDDDQMWTLMSDTMIMKSKTPKKSSLRLSPVKKRPSTAPTNPFRQTQGPPYMSNTNQVHRLRVGICSPSFYKRRHSMIRKRPTTSSPTTRTSTLLTQKKTPLE
jgi:hypothetical protein